MKKLECHIEVIDTGKANPDYFICRELYNDGEYSYRVFLYNEGTEDYSAGTVSKVYDSDKSNTFILVERDPVLINGSSLIEWSKASVYSLLHYLEKDYNQV